MNKKAVQSLLKKILNKAVSVTNYKEIISKIINLIETITEELTLCQEKLKQRDDEINRLKGEQGTPKFRKEKKDKTNTNHSSEENRKLHKKKNTKKPKEKKNNSIRIDREVICYADKDKLPDDAVFKGYDEKITQNIEIKTDNVKFKREVYYSPSMNKTFTANGPDGYQGAFAPGVKATVLSLYNDSKMTHPAIKRFLNTFRLHISKGTISRMLTDNLDVFHNEKQDIIKAGLLSTEYQHFDDTSARVNGKNNYTHVLCNPFYSAYFTVPKKDRITVLEILCHEELKFTLNATSFKLMSELGLAQKHLSGLKVISSSVVKTRCEIDELINKLFAPYKNKKHIKNRKIILEASAITYYRSSEYAIKFLVCDDAPQFNDVAQHKALCWIHEGRHYKKLNPITSSHRAILDAFIERFWAFYRELLAYKEDPSQDKAVHLSKEFDEIFSTKTGYDDLDDRIAKTLAKKEKLMLVLEFPFLPLHNNPAEHGARHQARHRDINLQTRNKKGTEAKDTLATIVQTARKLQVNLFDYIKDRVSGKFEMKSLASIIKEKSEPVLTPS